MSSLLPTQAKSAFRTTIQALHPPVPTPSLHVQPALPPPPDPSTFSEPLFSISNPAQIQPESALRTTIRPLRPLRRKQPLQAQPVLPPQSQMAQSLPASSATPLKPQPAQKQPAQDQPAQDQPAQDQPAQDQTVHYPTVKAIPICAQAVRTQSGHAQAVYAQEVYAQSSDAQSEYTQSEHSQQGYAQPVPSIPGQTQSAQSASAVLAQPTLPPAQESSLQEYHSVMLEDQQLYDQINEITYHFMLCVTQLGVFTNLINEGHVTLCNNIAKHQRALQEFNETERGSWDESQSWKLAQDLGMRVEEALQTEQGLVNNRYLLELLVDQMRRDVAMLQGEKVGLFTKYENGDV